MDEKLSEDNIRNKMKELLKKLIPTIRSSNQLPQNPSEFLLSQTYPSVKELHNKYFALIYDKIQKIAKFADLNVSIPPFDVFCLKPSNTDELMDILVDANDQMVYRANRNFDRILFHSKPKQESSSISTSKESLSISATGESSSNRNKYFDIIKNTLNISKPQLQFKRIIPNSNEPYIPKLSHKPNSKIELHADQSSVVSMIKHKLSENIDHNHPYLYEIYSFEPDNFNINHEFSGPTLIGQTPLILIDTVDKLDHLVNKLNNVNEFSFDLECHSIRSYQGFTCLIQISTRNEDYIIDTISLHDNIHILNDVFTNPRILKIGHGTDHDIIWLQRDFDIFVVNLFDTQKACKIFHGIQYSLANAVEKYFNISLNKAYQLADWRQRPLSPEMIDYARGDSHYLLSLYDTLMSEMFTKTNDLSLIKTTFQASKSICMKLYKKPVFDPTQYKNLKKWWSHTDKIKNHCFLKLCKWRDDTARVFDESTHHVISNSKLLWITHNLHLDIEFLVKKIKSHLDHELHSVLDDVSTIISEFQSYNNCPDWIEDEDISLPVNPPVAVEILQTPPIEKKDCQIDNLFSSNHAPYTESKPSKLDIPFEKYEGFMIYKNGITSSINNKTNKKDIPVKSKKPVVEKKKISQPKDINITVTSLKIDINPGMKRKHKETDTQNKFMKPSTIDSIQSTEDPNFNYSSFKADNFTRLPYPSKDHFQNKSKQKFKKKKK